MTTPQKHLEPSTPQKGEWEKEFEKYFSANALGGEDINRRGTMIALSFAIEVAKDFIRDLLLRTERTAREAGANEAVNYIERSGYEIKDLRVQDNKLNVLIDKLPEGQSVLLVSNKVLDEARSLPPKGGSVERVEGESKDK